jgi:hypothetical protein
VREEGALGAQIKLPPNKSITLDRPVNSIEVHAGAVRVGADAVPPGESFEAGDEADVTVATSDGAVILVTRTWSPFTEGLGRRGCRSIRRLRKA